MLTCIFSKYQKNLITLLFIIVDCRLSVTQPQPEAAVWPTRSTRATQPSTPTGPPSSLRSSSDTWPRPGPSTSTGASRSWGSRAGRGRSWTAPATAWTRTRWDQSGSETWRIWSDSWSTALTDTAVLQALRTSGWARRPRLTGTSGESQHAELLRQIIVGLDWREGGKKWVWGVRAEILIFDQINICKHFLPGKQLFW